jgi:outer membrane protein TolC
MSWNDRSFTFALAMFAFVGCKAPQVASTSRSYTQAQAALNGERLNSHANVADEKQATHEEIQLVSAKLADEFDKIKVDDDTSSSDREQLAPKPTKEDSSKPHAMGEDKADNSDGEKKSSEAEDNDAIGDESFNEVSVDLITSGAPTSIYLQKGLSVSDAIHTALSGNKTIAVLGYIPQETGTFISTELSAFDPTVGLSVKGGKYDRQLSNFIDSGGAVPSNEQQTDFLSPRERNNLSISRLLESGGTVEAGFGTNYLFQDPVGGFVILNPSWRSSLNVGLTQPLGRGRGRSVTTAPLRIAQANQHRASHEFQAQVNAVVRDVQIAYWNYKVASREYEVRLAAVQRASVTLTQEQERLKLEEGSIPDVRQAEDQLLRFQAEAMLAKNRVIQSRITLAQAMGYSPSELDLTQATDEPTSEVNHDREYGEIAALSRPELLAAQAQLRAAEIQLSAARNNVRSDLDLRLDYAVTGLEGGLDDSIETILDNQYNDWIVGLDYKRAIGLRAACAEVRRARIQLSRTQAEREQLELNIFSDVARAWNELQTNREAAEIQSQRRKIAQELLDARVELFEEGESSLDLKVRAEATLLDAELAELASRVAVQQSIVRWEYATGQQYYIEFADN